MKYYILSLTIITALSASPLFAEDDAKCNCKKEREEMQMKMEGKMKGGEAELNALLDQMNTSTGDKKIEAMAALLNKLLQEHKAMHGMMGPMHGMMMGHEQKSDGEAAKPSEHQH